MALPPGVKPSCIHSFLDLEQCIIPSRMSIACDEKVLRDCDRVDAVHSRDDKCVI